MKTAESDCLTLTETLTGSLSIPEIHSSAVRAGLAARVGGYMSSANSSDYKKNVGNKQ